MSCIYSLEFTKAEIAENKGLLSMEIVFNQECNFNCTYCYAEHVNGAQLSKETFFDALYQAKDLGARKIIILGGEPTLYAYLPEMITFIRLLGLEIELFTNGAAITKEYAELFFANNVRVILKMNSHDETTQDELANHPGAYRQIQIAFANLTAAGYPQEGKHLGISSVICEQNIEEIPKLFVWAKDKGIKPYFEIMTPQGRAKELSVPIRPLEKLFFDLAYLDRAKYNSYWTPQPPLLGGACMRHKYSCYINFDGSVQSCVGIPLILGNIKTKSLKRIISQSEVIQNLKDHKIHGPCSTCEISSTCYGCRGTAYQITGDYLASDPLCWRPK